MAGRKNGAANFTRWYDRTPALSQAVRMMEKLPVAHQQAIAYAIVGSRQLHHMTERPDRGVKKLGTEKVMGLMKAKGKRRWYDNDPMVHQAFNYIFLMNDTMRYEIAVKIIISSKALEVHVEQGGSPLGLPEVAKSIFGKQLIYLIDRTEFLINSDNGVVRIPPKVRIHNPEARRKAINSNNEGLRVIHSKEAVK